MPRARYSTLTATTPSTQSAASLRLEARGRLASALGQPGQALAHFTAAGATADSLGLVSPGFLPWRSWAAQAAIRAGHGEQAAGLIADELILARRAGNSRSAGSHCARAA